MSMDYKLRKDVDKIMDMVNTLSNQELVNTDSLKKELSMYYDMSELDVAYAKLDKDLKTLSTDLTDLSESFIEFNEELNSFNNDNESFSNNIQTLLTKISTVVSDVTQLKADSLQLTSDLTLLDGDLKDLSDNLDGLTDDLNTLSTYLTTFEGDLTQFQNKLRTDLGTTEYNNLNSDLVKLVGAITNVKKRTTATEENITTVQGDITNNVKPDLAQVIDDVGDNNSGLIKDVNDLETLIGNPKDTGTSTIYGNINTTQGHIDTVNTYLYGDGSSDQPAYGSIMYKINNILDNDIPAVEGDIADINCLMYGSASGSSSDYTSTSIWGRIQELLGRIDDAETYMGDVNYVNSGSLKTQIDRIYGLFKGMYVSFVTVDTLPVASNEVNSRGNYDVASDFDYDAVYVSSTGKYYVRKYLWGQ